MATESREAPVPVKLARVGAAAGIAAGGMWGMYENRAAIEQSVNELIPSVAAHWNALLEARIPSQGEIFNPKASKGEISSQNSIVVPTAEAVKLAKEKSQTPGDGIFIALSSIEPDSKIEYWKYGTSAGEKLGLKGIPIGSKMSLPYDVEVSWVKYANGHFTIWVQSIKAPWAKEDDNIFMVIGGKSFSIVNSGRFGTAPAPEGGTRSSIVQFKAGEPIIQIESNDLNEYASGGPEQLSVGVSLSKQNMQPGERTKPLSIKVLADEHNQKAITVN